MGLSFWHLVVLLVVVVLVFGTKRLRNAGQDLGEAVKGFKQGVREDDKPTDVSDAKIESKNDTTPPQA